MAAGPTEARARRRILIAEDDEITQEFLKLLLVERGYDVDLAGDGRAALAALQSHTYDVVLLDFHLPQMDGLEVASAHRASASGKLPRFIAITADVKGLLACDSSSDAFDTVIPKPFHVRELCRLIDG